MILWVNSRDGLLGVPLEIGGKGPFHSLKAALLYLDEDDVKVLHSGKALKLLSCDGMWRYVSFASLQLEQQTLVVVTCSATSGSGEGLPADPKTRLCPIAPCN